MGSKKSRRTRDAPHLTLTQLRRGAAAATQEPNVSSFISPILLSIELTSAACRANMTPPAFTLRAAAMKVEEMLGHGPAVMISLVVRPTQHQPQQGDYGRVQTGVTSIATHRALQLGTATNLVVDDATSPANRARAGFWAAMHAAQAAASLVVLEEWQAGRLLAAELPASGDEVEVLDLYTSHAIMREYR